MGMTRNRVKQLNEIFEELQSRFKEEWSVVLCGDFNFSPDMEPEQTRLDAAREFKDVWVALHGDKPEYTEDTDINLMRLEHSGKPKRVRFDRMLLRATNQQLQPQAL